MSNTNVADVLEKYKDLIASLPEELQKKVREASSMEELQGILGEMEGELPDELAEAVAGGKGADYDRPSQFPCYCILLKNIADVFTYQWAKRGNEVYVVKRDDGSVVVVCSDVDIPAGFKHYQNSLYVSMSASPATLRSPSTLTWSAWTIVRG